MRSDDSIRRFVANLQMFQQAVYPNFEKSVGIARDKEVLSSASVDLLTDSSVHFGDLVPTIKLYFTSVPQPELLVLSFLYYNSGRHGYMLFSAMTKHTPDYHRNRQVVFDLLVTQNQATEEDRIKLIGRSGVYTGTTFKSVGETDDRKIFVDSLYGRHFHMGKHTNVMDSNFRACEQAVLDGTGVDYFYALKNILVCEHV